MSAKITPQEFTKLFAEAVSERGQFAQMYEQFVATIPEAKISDKHFCEFLILSLFIDCLCLTWVFNRKAAVGLCNLYVERSISEIGKTGAIIYGESFKNVLKARFAGYQQIVSEINPDNLDTQKALRCLTSLGESFSKHFVGYENLETILKVKWFFLMKEDTLYGKFLKRIRQDYELTV